MVFKPSISGDMFRSKDGNRDICRDFSNNLLLSNFGLHSNQHSNADALQAVKLDPAVLEAQVTVHSNNTVDNSSGTEPTAVVEEDKESKADSDPMKGYEDMISQYEQAFLSLSPQQLEMLLKYAATLRRQRTITQKFLECAFCKNNGRPVVSYKSHALKDWRGRVQCPVLRRFLCPRCGATGDHAHTIKYCPENSLIDTSDL